MVKKLETSSHRGPFYVLGMKIEKFKVKTFFFRDHQIFATGIKFYWSKWVVKSYLALKSGAQYEKG